MLHNTLDPAVPFVHEMKYNELATQAGSGRFFTSMPVPTYGHCNFTAQQVLGAFAWLVQQAGP